MSIHIALDVALTEDADSLNHPYRQSVALAVHSAGASVFTGAAARVESTLGARWPCTATGPGTERAMPGKSVACAYAIVRRATNGRTVHSPPPSHQAQHRNLRPRSGGRTVLPS